MQLNVISRIGLNVVCLVIIGCHARDADSDAPPLRIIATDAGFEAPDRIAAGMRHIVYENRGSEIHECMLVKLAPGMTLESYVAEVKKGASFPEGAMDYSGPGLMSPGEMAEMWLTVDPGNYILICWNNGHATTVPVHPFIVGQETRDDRVPKEDRVCKLSDYKFEFSSDLTKGMHVIRVETPGPSMHEMDIFRLNDGKTVADVNAWRKEPTKIAAPAQALGGVLDNHDTHRVVWLRKNFTPGRYVLHCEMTVTNSKLTHADVGMVREFEVKD